MTDRLIWVDIETTGVDEDSDSILEVACVVTDRNLVVLDELNVVLRCPLERDSMVEWVRSTHSSNGLFDDCDRLGVELGDAEERMLAFVISHCEPGVSPMCGSTISFYRAFLKRHMPRLHGFFHYRNIDVSTVKQLSRMWRGVVHEGERGNHRALADIKVSIDELRTLCADWIDGGGRLRCDE